MFLSLSSPPQVNKYIFFKKLSERVLLGEMGSLGRGALRTKKSAVPLFSPLLESEGVRAEAVVGVGPESLPSAEVKP